MRRERLVGPSPPVAFLATRVSPADVAFAPNRLTNTFDRPVNRSLGRLTLVRAENAAPVKSEPSRSSRSEPFDRLFAINTHGKKAGRRFRRLPAVRDDATTSERDETGWRGLRAKPVGPEV
jgi:hypothetical protein